MVFSERTAQCLVLPSVRGSADLLAAYTFLAQPVPSVRFACLADVGSLLRALSQALPDLELSNQLLEVGPG